MTLADLAPVFPNALADWLAALLAEMPKWEIDEPNEIASFLAEAGYETRGFTRFEENLNYSAARLVAVWPARFYLPPATPKPGQANASLYAYQPRSLADHVYCDRMENGHEGSGDGWKYRGRGALMLTGRKNYRIEGEALALPLVDKPELVLRPDIGAKVACHFWHGGFDRIDDDRDIHAETRLLNGGLTGFADRARYFQALLKLNADQA